MQNYAGNSTNFPAYVRLPEGTDPRNATVAAAGLEDLADRTAHMYEIITAVPPNASEVVPLDLGSARAPAIGSSTESSWIRLISGNNTGYNEIWSSSGYASDPLLIEATPSLLKPCRVTSLGVILRGYATDQMPTSLPRICLMRRSFFLGGSFSGTGTGAWDEATTNTALTVENLAQYTSSNGITFEVNCDVVIDTIGQYCWALRVLSDVVQAGHGQGISVRVAWLRTQRIA